MQARTQRWPMAGHPQTVQSEERSKIERCHHPWSKFKEATTNRLPWVRHTKEPGPFLLVLLPIQGRKVGRDRYLGRKDRNVTAVPRLPRLVTGKWGHTERRRAGRAKGLGANGAAHGVVSSLSDTHSITEDTKPRKAPTAAPCDREHKPRVVNVLKVSVKK